MSWNVVYLDAEGRKTRSRTMDTSDVALAQACDLHHQQRAQVIRIEGGNGETITAEAALQWCKANSDW